MPSIRAREGAQARAWAEPQSFQAVAERAGGDLRRPRVAGVARRPGRRPLDDRDWIVVDLHLHTNWSHDCSIAVDELLDHAEAEGLGAIAVTDHNVFGGALEAVEQARGRELVVIPGEEVKTDGAGRGDRPLPQGGDPARAVVRGDGRGDPRAGRPRLRPAPVRPAAHDSRPGDDPAPPGARSTCFEVYNARLLFEAYNDEALRFARKYSLTRAPARTRTCSRASGPAPCGCAVRRPGGVPPRLRSAEVLRRPKSLAYLQGLKWVAQAKERVR